MEHFTTYGLDDDDDESEFADDTQMQYDSSGLSDAPATPTEEHDMTMQSMETGTGEMEDTFQFKIDRRSQLSVPGGFNSEGVTDYEEPSLEDDMVDDSHVMSGGLGNMEDPFTSPGGAVQAPSPGAVERYHSSMMDEDLEEAVDEVEQDIPGSFVAAPHPPKSILKPSTGLDAFVSPQKFAMESWEEQLQRTMSPKKRDRQALKEMQQSLFKATNEDGEGTLPRGSLLGQSGLDQSYLAQRSAKKTRSTNDKTTSDKQALGQSAAFRGSMDIMKSLFDKDVSAGRKANVATKGFEV